MAHSLKPDRQFISARWTQHPILGTDNLGRSLAVRIGVGISTSLWVSLSALSIAIFLSIVLAIASSRLPYVSSKLILQIPQVLFIIPSILLSSALFHLTRMPNLALWITLIISPLLTLTQYLHLSLQNQQSCAYWQYGLSLGPSLSHSLLYHQVPYSLHVIVPFAVSRFAGIVSLESSLSFLGLGLQDPHISLGLLIQQSIPYMQRYPHFFLLSASSFISLLFLIQWLSLKIQKIFHPY